MMSSTILLSPSGMPGIGPAASVTAGILLQGHLGTGSSGRRGWRDPGNGNPGRRRVATGARRNRRRGNGWDGGNRRRSRGLGRNSGRCGRSRGGGGVSAGCWPVAVTHPRRSRTRNDGRTWRMICGLRMKSVGLTAAAADRARVWRAGRVGLADAGRLARAAGRRAGAVDAAGSGRARRVAPGCPGGAGSWAVSGPSCGGRGGQGEEFFVEGDGSGHRAG